MLSGVTFVFVREQLLRSSFTLESVLNQPQASHGLGTMNEVGGPREIVGAGGHRTQWGNDDEFRAIGESFDIVQQLPRLRGSRRVPGPNQW
jgi:hypothetical protein